MCSGRDWTSGTICLKTVAVIRSSIVEVEFVDSRSEDIRKFCQVPQTGGIGRDDTYLGSTCEPGPSVAVKPGALV
jgi:hypothetical protein